MAAVFEVVFDDVAEVVDGEVDFADSCADEVDDDAFEDGSSCDFEHGFWDVFGEFTEAHAFSSGHDDGVVREGVFGDHFSEAMDADELHAVVDDGDVLDGACADEVEDVGAGGVFGDPGEVAVDVRGDGVVHGGAVEEHAAEVAIGHESDEAAIGVVDHDGAGDGAGVDALHRFPDGGGFRDGAVV